MDKTKQQLLIRDEFLAISSSLKKIQEEYAMRIMYARLTPNAISHIKARLKSFSLDELLKAIDNFSKDSWWMKNNKHRGMAWFFKNDDRIEQFIAMIPKKQTPYYIKV